MTDRSDRQSVDSITQSIPSSSSPVTPVVIHSQTSVLWFADMGVYTSECVHSPQPWMVQDDNIELLQDPMQTFASLDAVPVAQTTEMEIPSSHGRLQCEIISVNESFADLYLKLNFWFDLPTQSSKLGFAYSELKFNQMGKDIDRDLLCSLTVVEVCFAQFCILSCFSNWL